MSRESSAVCGKCGHEMHWHSCDTLVLVDGGIGVCLCRNDVETLAPNPDPLFAEDEPDPPTTRPGCIQVALFALLVLAAAWTGPQPQEGGDYLDSRSALDSGAVITQPVMLSRIPVTASPLASSGSEPAPSGAVAGPKYTASATWCKPTPDYCQSWGGNARLAAVNSFGWGDRPYWVRLTRGDAFADALVVSHCACHGQDRYIDVSPAVFRQLAPLSRGRIDVEVEVLSWPYEPGGDPPPHPSDEEMRAEDNPSATLPPTDQ